MLIDVPPPLASRRGPSQRLLAALLALGGGHARLVRHREAPWASVTFAGERQVVTLRFEGHAAVDAADALIAQVGEHEFAVPGRLVAEATVTAVDQAVLPEPRLDVTLELLTLEDA